MEIMSIQMRNCLRLENKEGGCIDMSKIKNKIAKGGIYVLVYIIIFALLLGINWIATCGIIKLITICFSLTFKWNFATGIWLILLLLGGVFREKSI
jgi:hypothetical protein